MKAFALVVSTLLVVTWSAAQNSRVSWYEFNADFAVPASALSKTTSVVGQPLVGSSQDPSSTVLSGFLADTLLRGMILAVREPVPLPAQFSLAQNYPNPFNPATTIRYTVPARTHVSLTVFDLLGRKVATLVNEEKEAGEYATSLDTRLSGVGVLASGVYFYVMHTAGFVSTRRMIVLK